MVIKESVCYEEEYEDGIVFGKYYYHAEGTTLFGQTDQGTKISEAEFEKTLKDWKDNNHSVNDLNVKTYNIKDFK